MPAGINSFSQGLNQDNSRSKYSPQNYYYLLNGKIVTEEGLSSGSATNKKGNTSSFSIPSTAPVYEILVPSAYTGTSQLQFVSSSTFLVSITATTIEEIYQEILDNTSIDSGILNGDFAIFLDSERIVIVGLDSLTSVTLTTGTLTLTTVVSAKTNLQICGWENLENKLIIFTTDETSDTPSDSAGQIWEVEYDEATQTIIDINGTSLVPSEHLKYNNILNFSLAHRIGEVIGRYENSKIRGVYWTDNYNLLRSFNLANTKGLGLHPSSLDVRADLDLSTPVIEQVGNGSIPIGSTVQYGYRLKAVNGATTIISPFSPPTPLAENPATGNYEDFKGSPYNTSDSRSVTYRIKDIDTSYTLIEHIVILYENLDVPQVYSFKEEFVPISGELLVTHTGSEDYLQLSLQELNVINHPFRCKTITAKRNKLIAGNINYKKVKIDYDARAYRYNGSGVSNLYDKQGVLEYTLPTTPYSGIPETADAINPYNDESGTIFQTASGNPSTWDSSYQFKYQSDGATLGGEGQNVKYTFIKEETIGNQQLVGSTPPWVSVSRNPTNINSTTGETTFNQTYFRDFKSPLISTYLKGYKRGEIYRFGIVFFDKKGTPSMVNWIGDIRFPETHEFEDYGEGTSVSSIVLNQIGIQFEINVASILSDISGFSIVRVERQEGDKTRLGTGIPIGLTNNTTDQYSSLEGLFGQALSENIEINSTPFSDVYYLQDFPGETAFSNLFTTIFPFHQFNSQFSFKTGDYLKEGGHYNTKPYCTYYDSTGDNTLGVFYEGYSFASLSSYNRFLIEKVASINYREYADADDFISGDINTIVNTSYSRDGSILTPDFRTPLGLGNRKLITLIDTSPTTGFSSSFNSGWNNGIFGGGSSAPTVGSTFGSGDFEMKIIDYCRFPVNQYGGASYESRAANTYISTGQHIRLDNTASALQTVDVFGGDTYTTYYSDEYITMHWEDSSNSSPFNSEPSNNKLSCAVAFPCETHINFNLRHGNTFSDDQDYAGTFTKTLYEYNEVYHQNSNAIQQYISPSIIDTDTDEHPHQLIASQEKIDGEAFDSWRIFSPNDLIEVDGNHGDINKIITYRDKVFFFQTRAVGVVSVQERATTQDLTGTDIVLGTGGILDFYQYITTNSGCFHQFSVIQGNNGIYYIDTLSRKAMLLSDGERPISTIEGLSAFFDTLLQGDIQIIDNTIYYNTPLPIGGGNPAVGIHGVYDRRNHCVIWTILKGERALNVSLFGGGAGGYGWQEDNTTIVYNELMQSFEEFSSATPRLWLDNYRRLLSTDPDNMEDVYIHNTGTRGQFYGTLYDFKITIVINTQPELTKILDTIEYLMDLKTSSGADIATETFNTLRIYNSYQDTGTLTLTPQTNIKRRLRKWRINTLRDNATNKPRLRDYHFFLELTYNNNANKELILHDIVHYIRPSNF